MMSATKVSQAFAQHPSAIICGGIVGVALALWWPAVVDISTSVYDDVAPIVKGQAALIERTGNRVVISVQFTRSELRESCVFLRRQGYAVTVGGVRIPINAERLDNPAQGHSLPAGTYTNTWALWPVDGAYRVMLYTQHDCSGRLVSTVLADVKL